MRHVCSHRSTAITYQPEVRGTNKLLRNNLDHNNRKDNDGPAVQVPYLALSYSVSCLFLRIIPLDGSGRGYCFSLQLAQWSTCFVIHVSIGQAHWTSQTCAQSRDLEPDHRDPTGSMCRCSLFAGEISPTLATLAFIVEIQLRCSDIPRTPCNHNNSSMTSSLHRKTQPSWTTLDMTTVCPQRCCSAWGAILARLVSRRGRRGAARILTSRIVTVRGRDQLAC